MLEQIVDRNRQIVVWIHQTRRGHDAVTVIIGIVAERQIELVAVSQQACHCAFGRTVHAHNAIFIQMHKAEGLIDCIVYQRQIQLVMLSNTLPVSNT